MLYFEWFFEIFPDLCLNLALIQVKNQFRYLRDQIQASLEIFWER